MSEILIAQITAFAPDMRDEFLEAIEQKANDLRGERKFIKSARLRRTLRNDLLFERVYAQAVSSASVAFVASSEYDIVSANHNVGTQEFDGEFLKYLLDWFENGGWEVIVAFIKALMGLSG